MKLPTIYNAKFVILCLFRTAKRTDSYNQGVIVTNRPLKENEMFEVKLDGLSNRWTSSLMIGALFEAPERIHLPVTALGFKKNAIIISGGMYNCVSYPVFFQKLNNYFYVIHNGVKYEHEHS